MCASRKKATGSCLDFHALFWIIPPTPTPSNSPAPTVLCPRPPRETNQRGVQPRLHPDGHPTLQDALPVQSPLCGSLRPATAPVAAPPRVLSSHPRQPLHQHTPLASRWEPPLIQPCSSPNLLKKALPYPLCFRQNQTITFHLFNGGAVTSN